MKKVRGYFALVILQFDDTMAGADYHYTPWCIGGRKFCRFTRQEQLTLFPTHRQAQEYMAKLPVLDNQRYEIAYLTTQNSRDDTRDKKQLTRWVKVQRERDALQFDKKQYAAMDGTVTAAQVPWWNNKQFDAVYNTKK